MPTVDYIYQRNERLCMQPRGFGFVAFLRLIFVELK